MMSLGEIAFLVLLVAFAFAIGYGAGKVKRFKRSPEEVAMEIAELAPESMDMQPLDIYNLAHRAAKEGQK